MITLAAVGSGIFSGSLGGGTQAMARAKSDFGHGRTHRVDCDAYRQSIGAALVRAHAGDTILVRGTCKETLTLDKSITLDGGGSARLGAANPTDKTLTITGRDVTVRGFRLESPAVFQVFVHAGAIVSLEQNTFRKASNFGLSVAGNSHVVMLGNTITDNGLGGVIGLNGAELVFGTRTSFDAPDPNVIADNGRLGVVLIGNAGARLLGGNTISGHDLGVLVQDGAQAQIAGNIIDGNGIGIFLEAGGVVQLPFVTNAVPAFTELNSGVNSQLGIACKGGTIRGVPDGLAPAVRLPPTPGVLAGPSDGLSTHCLDQTESLPPSAP
jgi:hypothetical protein